MKNEIKTETKQIRSIHVGALNDYGWPVSGLMATIGSMQFEIEIFKYVTLHSAGLTRHAQWSNPENQGAARHLAIKITTKIAFCRGA